MQQLMLVALSAVLSSILIVAPAPAQVEVFDDLMCYKVRDFRSNVAMIPDQVYAALQAPPVRRSELHDHHP